jgi:hypothetical protein
MDLRVVPTPAPTGRQNRAWWREPQEYEALNPSQALKGRQQAAEKTLLSPPRGFGGLWDLPFLGLTPPGFILPPLRG